MRKTCLYWNPKFVNILDSQHVRLKILTSLYPTLLISPSPPPKLSPTYDYILMASSEQEPIYHPCLSCTIVYCMKLPTSKKTEIQRMYHRYMQDNKVTALPALYVTDSFKEVLLAIVKELGYEDQVQGQTIQNKRDGDKDDIEDGNRFLKEFISKENAKNDGEFVLRQQFNAGNIREACKALKLEYSNIQKQDIRSLSKTLVGQLKSYLSQKKIPFLDPEFSQMRQAKTLTDLCRACLHFYTLEKHHLYHNLNLLLRNIRSIGFREQLEKLKLFAFLLMLNYMYAYSREYSLDEHSAPPVLYRYTDCQIDPSSIGQILTTPSFYSTTSNPNLQQFTRRLTRLQIHPLIEHPSSLSINSLFPIHNFSAYRKEQEYLFLPFTCFMVMQVRYHKGEGQWHVVLREVPGNPVVRGVLQVNLWGTGDIKAKGTGDGQYTAEWELKCQHRYEGSADLFVRVKTSVNLGLIFMRLMEKYELATNYFLQAIQLLQKVQKFDPLTKGIMALKCLNYLGLSYIKNQKLKEAGETFKKAQKKLQQTIQIQQKEQKQKDKINVKKSNTNNPESLSNPEKLSDPFLYLSAAFRNNQALLSEAYEVYHQAVLQYKQALAMLAKCFVKNQLMEACIRGNIGVCLSRSTKNNEQDCFTYLKDAYMQCLRVYGVPITEASVNPQTPLKLLVSILPVSPPIPQLLPVLQSLSTICQNNSELSLAIKFQSSAINLYKSLHLVEHSESVALMYMKSTHARLLQKMGNYGEAIRQFEELLGFVRLVDDMRVKAAIFMGNIAGCYVGVGGDQQLEKAVWWYSEAIRQLSSPLLSENLTLYNKFCDLRSDISGYLKVCSNKTE